MIVLGLTGSIGMGKSTTAAMFRAHGIPVHDADAEVHRAMAKGGAGVAAVAAAFPGTVKDGAVDRAALGARVFGDDAALRQLESILHPLVRQSQAAFLKNAVRHRRRLVVLDIPLLFETGGEALCDAVVVVTAPPPLQRRRVLARGGMSEERLAEILARQMPDVEKRRRADFLVPTGLGRAFSFRAVGGIIRTVLARPPRRTSPSAIQRRRRAHA